MREQGKARKGREGKERVGKESEHKKKRDDRRKPRQPSNSFTAYVMLLSNEAGRLCNLGYF